MKSIKEFENFKVENLKYFTGGGTSGAGEACIAGTCCTYESDYTDSTGKAYAWTGVNGIDKPCEA